MQIDEVPLPLTAAAKLLRDYGKFAISEAGDQILNFNRHGDTDSVKFWVDVMIEVFDAQAAVTGHLQE